MGQQTSSHNDAPPPPSIPLTPRCGRAVRQVNDVLERGGWRVFESCDDDFTGVVSLEEIRAKFIEVLRSSTTASSLSLPALNAFLACCDRGDGFVDHGGWQKLREHVACIAKRETVEAPPGHPRGTMVVLPPGALVREGVQRDARRKAKLKTGTQLLSMGDEEVLGDGTRRTRVTWSLADEGCIGWVSSKNCAPLAAPPIVIDAAPPRTPPRRSTTWLDRAAAASSGSPTRTRPDALLLEGASRPPRRRSDGVDAQATRASSSAPRRNDARTSTSSCASRRLTEWPSSRRRRRGGRAVATPSERDTVGFGSMASRWTGALAEPRAATAELGSPPLDAAAAPRTGGSAGLGSPWLAARRRRREREIAPQARDGHKTHNRRRVLTPRTPSRDSLDEAAETSPRPKADWTPRRRLKFYGRRLADDSLSDNQIRRLREGLLGEYGLNWRRDRERDVAAALAKAASDLREGAMGEIWRSGRAGRPTRRHVLARLLHAVSVIAAPDPALVTPSRVERVARGLSSASTRDLLLLSRWASSEFVRASETVKRWSENVTSPRPMLRPKFLERQALDALVSVAMKSCGADASPNDIRHAIATRFDRITRSRLLAEMPAPSRIWCVSDLHIDVPLNLERCLAFEARPDDALIVAGDVCSEPLLFEKFFADVVKKFKYVFYVPGNHDLWCLSEGDLASDSLTKMFRQLLVCDRLGVITHSVQFSNRVCMVPLFGWYDPSFVDGDADDWISGFDPFCRWPACLGDDASVAQFLASLNEASVRSVRQQENAVVLSFSHFLPRSSLFEGAGGCRSLGKVMGDARLEDQIQRLCSSVHVFGHSHIDVDCVLDGVRYVQHALGHPEDGVCEAYQPVVVWDAY